jgi:hypothetical protein
MDHSTLSRIRHIFLHPHPSFALMTAADLLGMTLKELRQEIEGGSIVAVSTSLGQRVTRRGDDRGGDAGVGAGRHRRGARRRGSGGAAGGDRLVELRARVPRYQREMLRYLAQRGGTTVDEVLTRETEDVACAHSEELVAAVPGFEIAFGWPESAAVVPN